MPLYYRAAAALLTQADTIQVLGDDSSGEVEPVLVGARRPALGDVGADHTDRKVESYSVAVSKQICEKPVGRTAWRFEEVEPHWDSLIAASASSMMRGKRVLYQEGPLGQHSRAARADRGLGRATSACRAASAMFCGTLPCDRRRSGRAERFEMELEDPACWVRTAHA